MRNCIHILLNDQPNMLQDVGTGEMLLDFLRQKKRLTGSKEGCAEGDCGACTVLVGRLIGKELLYEPVNGCIRFLSSLDGCHIVTIEHLRGYDGQLHPIQQAMLDHHASQCGFCTPGIIMALYALWMRVAKPTREQIEQALQGNLCRCTGYEPIIKAAQMVTQATDWPRSDPLLEERQRVKDQLKHWQDDSSIALTKQGDLGKEHIFIPKNEADLAELYAQYPDATLIAGATDAGLWVTKFLKTLPTLIHIGQVPGLKRISQTKEALILGATASYEEAMPVLLDHFPMLKDYLLRIGGWQVRSMGTIGGNIANGSPIGDMPPILIALGASITLKSKQQEREIELENFFLDYGKQDRQPGEYLHAIQIPLPSDKSHVTAYKISKRRDEDISSVAVGFNLIIKDKIIQSAHIAFGGMAGIPKRASHAEQALINKPFTQENMIKAAEKLTEDFTPLSDMRASAAYRMKVAQNLFRRFYLEHSAPQMDDKTGEAAQ
ncbi:MAG: xanthine dehydrogenase small subunit [Cohaesibacter sp.]|nr:xanthine dehydrogenase small subunit [Cohaesibacter sp.]